MCCKTQKTSGEHFEVIRPLRRRQYSPLPWRAQWRKRLAQAMAARQSCCWDLQSSRAQTSRVARAAPLTCTAQITTSAAVPSYQSAPQVQLPRSSRHTAKYGVAIWCMPRYGPRVAPPRELSPQTPWKLKRQSCPACVSSYTRHRRDLRRPAGANRNATNIWAGQNTGQLH